MKQVVSGHALAIETVMVNGSTAPVELQVYEGGNGSYFAVDGSWLEQCTEDDAPLYIADPYNEGCSIRLVDTEDEIKEERATLVSGDVNQSLIDNVIEEMKRHIAEGDLTSIDELLGFIPDQNLKAFLPDCPYCEGDCVRDEDHACDEYLADGFDDDDEQWDDVAEIESCPDCGYTN